MSPPGNRTTFEMHLEQNKVNFSSRYDPETSSGAIIIGATNVNPECRDMPDLDIPPTFPSQLLDEIDGWKVVKHDCLATLCDLANIQQDNLSIGVVAKTVFNNSGELLLVNSTPVSFNEVTLTINSCSLHAFNAILANLGIQPAIIDHEAAEAHHGLGGHKQPIEDLCGR